MIFEIDFNNPKDTNYSHQFFEDIGCTCTIINPHTCIYKIELEKMGDLEALMLKINRMLLLCDYGYSAIIDWDYPTIHLDKDL